MGVQTWGLWIKVQFFTKLGVFNADYNWKNQNFPCGVWERGREAKGGWEREREREEEEEKRKVIGKVKRNGYTDNPKQWKQEWGPSYTFMTERKSQWKVSEI